jgi:hypothetical protein
VEAVRNKDFSDEIETEEQQVQRVEARLRTIEKINRFREDKLIRELQAREEEARLKASELKKKNDRYHELRKLMKIDFSNPAYRDLVEGKTLYKDFSDQVR